MRCGVGCWTRVEGAGGAAASEDATRAARKSASSPYSSSSIIAEGWRRNGERNIVIGAGGLEDGYVAGGEENRISR